MIVANLCVCKFKKHYNLRYKEEYQISETVGLFAIISLRIGKKSSKSWAKSWGWTFAIW